MPRPRLILCSILMLLAIAVLASFASSQQPTLQLRTHEAPASQALTTDVVYVIRHADTAEGENPDLSPAGVQRALSLATMLQDEPIAAVFVTNTQRSIQTGAPTATRFGIETTLYPPFDAQGLTRTITDLPGSNAALVVAHSNTVPMIVAALGGPQLEDLGESEFDRLFAVVLSNGRHVRTLELHYQ